MLKQVPVFSENKRGVAYIPKDISYISVLKGVTVIHYTHNSVYFKCSDNMTLAQIIVCSIDNIICQIDDPSYGKINVIVFQTDEDRNRFALNLEKFLIKRGVVLDLFTRN